MSHYYDAGREIALRRSDPRMWGDPYNFYGNGGSFGGAGATGSWGAPIAPMWGMSSMWGMPGAGLNPADPVSQEFMNYNLPARLRSTTAIEGRDARINMIESGHTGSFVGVGAGAAVGALAGAWAGIPGAIVGAIIGAIGGAHIGTRYARGTYAYSDMADGDSQMNGSARAFSIGIEEYM